MSLATAGGLRPVWRSVSYQPAAAASLAVAAERPVHAYLLVGPEGSGKTAAAAAFAAALVCPERGCGDCPHCSAVAAGSHEDVSVIRAAGPSLSIEEVRSLGALSLRRPRRARRQVLIVEGIESAAQVLPAMLKTIEEPPHSTVFVLLSERLGPDLATIASRCATISLPALRPEVAAAALVAEGFPASVASTAAEHCGGNLRRAREFCEAGDLATAELWAALPERLDGTGATVAALARELSGGLDAAVARFRLASSTSPEASEPAGKRARPAARSDADKRAERRLRRQELERGLADLSAAYRHRLRHWTRQAGPAAAEAAALASAAIEETAAHLVRNPNEELALLALLCRLDEIGRRAQRG